MKNSKYEIDLDIHREHILPILQEVVDYPHARMDKKEFRRLLRRYPRPDGGFYGRAHLIRSYRELAGDFGLPPYDEAVIERLRRKPVRTSSGVTPVTILTKPFPCPGTCIFCPNDVRMPKSYLADEPGAQRAEQNAFDPYLQTYVRLKAFHNTGHPTDKIELIILGGTWSFYPESYQIWFIKRAFDALHDFGKGIDRTQEVRDALQQASQFHDDFTPTNVTISGVDLQRSYNQVVQSIYHEEMIRSKDLVEDIQQGVRERSATDEFATWAELEAVHLENESADCRCVGLVIETRPDHISEEEVLRVRRLGCTKVQIGFQSLNDEVLRMNKRGHTVQATRRAVKLLRKTGFKIHAHWMPNLYGSTPEKDVEDYHRLFGDPDFRPDELKIYPCSLIESAELMQKYEDGTWQPYTDDELLYVLTESFQATPEYCRLTRVIRDIPSTDIVVGNQKPNFRQMAEQALERQGKKSPDIRSREIRYQQVSLEALHRDEMWYTTSCGEEVFIQYITADRQIAAFLRLALLDQSDEALTKELQGCAIIREVHVYGQSLGIGEDASGHAQHVGLGTQLLERSAEIACQYKYQKLAVISAIGTRNYYRKRGFDDGTLYQIQDLTK